MHKEIFSPILKCCKVVAKLHCKLFHNFSPIYFNAFHYLIRPVFLRLYCATNSSLYSLDY